MAGNHRTKSKSTSRKKSEKSVAWETLTWDDLDRWAGSRSVSRGRTYFRGGRVKDLVVAADGKLLATVTGGSRYATSVWLDPDASPSRLLGSQCSCPIGASCKHCVAVVAAYLQLLADGLAAPLADDHDPRWEKLTDDDDEADDEWLEDDLDDNVDDEEEDWEETRSIKRRRGRNAAPSSQASRSAGDKKIEAHVRAKSREELADLVCSLVMRFPELRTEFQERIALAEGNVDRLVADARREMRQVTDEAGWRHSWSGEGHTPNYERLKQRLSRLLEMGHADRVVELGRELIRLGFAQVSQSDDEGETGMAFAECLPVMFAAAVQSSLTPAQKILFAIDACLADDFDIIGEEADVILKVKWQPADWSAVADELAKRLKGLAGGGDQSWSRNYRRDAVSNWLLEALQHAGRDAELLTVYESEARLTGSYERLVKYLISEGRIADAERWAREGIEKSSDKLPGIASSLTRMLVEIAARRKDYKTVAAQAACEFFTHPDNHSFRKLLKAARTAQCEDAVRQWALKFLETGVAPWRVQTTKKNSPSALVLDPQWPLPLPDFLVPMLRLDAPHGRSPSPHFGVLLEMAIADKRPDDVLHWFDKWCQGPPAKRMGYGWDASFASYEERVADAVAKSHPERALAIYRRGLDSQLAQANPAAYESSVSYLRKMRPVLRDLGREAEWTGLLAEIRQKYKNRPKFMEILDRMERRPIVATSRRKGSN